jgi:hypothetical protein
MTPAPKGAPAYERLLFERAAAEIAGYCADARNELSADERRALRVVIHLYTDRDLGDVKRRIREHAAQAFAVELDGARLEALHHDIDPALGGTGFDVLIPRAFAAPDTDPAAAAPDPDGAPTLRLTLLYALDLKLEYRLRSLDAWLGLGRMLPRAGAYVPVELPVGVSAVPRGQLLLIRYHADLVQLRRTLDRPEYTVVVDGRPLEPRRQVVCGDHGTIEYHLAGGRQPSVIRYRVVEEG